MAELARLYLAACQELAGMRGGYVLVGLGGRDRQEGTEGSFSADLRDPNRLVVVGAPNGPAAPSEPPSELAAPSEPPSELAGYGACRLLELDSGELLGSIEELYVRPEARRAGLGRALAGSLVTWCTSRGCIGVDAMALPGSRAVKSFFEGEGFTARLLVMHRRLG